ncbi:MAG: HAD family hydrolase [candidate division NC10 bacterium]|nr:HAD family hydrolase [candidate division NC10 bacterium]
MDFPIKGVIFDLDGVIVKQKLDFAAIKQDIFGDSEGFILERMERLSGPERERAEEILEGYERAAAEEAELNDGVKPLFAHLDKRKTRRAVVTRNSRKSVAIVQEKFGLDLGVVISRGDAPPKPSPEPILLACRRMGLSKEECIFVGDFELDMLAGRRAGVRTVLLRNPAQPFSENADFTIDSISNLLDFLSP